MICHCLVLLCLLSFTLAAGNCAITEHPQSVVALLGTVASFSCRGESQSQLQMVFNESMTSMAVDRDEFEMRGITWVFDQQSYNISILASIQNNFTTIKCEYNGCTSNIAKLYVVEGLPVPAPPSLYPINYTSIEVSWRPLWPHPVDNYTLEYSSDYGSPQYITVDGRNTSVIVMRHEETECEEIRFRVRAGTDINDTIYSNATVGGLPKTLPSTISVTINNTVCGGSPHPPTYTVLPQRPDVCSYEDIHYNISVTDVATTETVPIILTPYGAIINMGGVYNISVTAINEVGDTVQWIQSFLDVSTIQSVNIDNYISSTQSLVAQLNDSVTIHCRANSTGDSVLIINNSLLHDSDGTHDPPSGINYTSLPNGYDVFVNVMHDTKVTCILASCTTITDVFLVDGPPVSPPTNIVVTALTNTASNISWSPPWPLPVARYSLMITNNQRVSSNITTSQQYYIITKNTSSECEEVEVTITAVTTVGDSPYSNTITTGYIRDLSTVDLTTPSYTLTNTSLTITANLATQCSYEEYNYTFTIMDINNKREYSSDTQNMSSVSITLNVLLPLIDYQGQGVDISVVITNGLSSITMTLFTAVALTAESATPTANISGESKFPSITLVGSLSGVIIGLLIVAIFIMLLAMILFFIRRSVVRRQANIRHTLPPMETNPTYDATLDFLYESIGDVKRDRPLPELPTNGLHLPSPTLTPSNGRPLSDAAPTSTCDADTDEYIEMAARGKHPRYVRTPVTTEPPEPEDTPYILHNNSTNV